MSDRTPVRVLATIVGAGTGLEGKRDWVHCVPKSADACGARISVNFQSYAQAAQRGKGGSTPGIGTSKALSVIDTNV